MGEVYRARDTRLDRTVALKIASPGAPTSTTRTTMRYITNWFEELRASVK